MHGETRSVHVFEVESAPSMMNIKSKNNLIEFKCRDRNYTLNIHAKSRRQ